MSEAAAECKCQLAKYMRSLRVSMGENEGESFFSARVLTTSKEHARGHAGVIEGLQDLAYLHVGDDSRAEKLIDALHVTTKGKALNIKWTASADVVWKMVEKHAERLAEQHGKMGWFGQKPAEKPGRRSGGDAFGHGHAARSRRGFSGHLYFQGPGPLRPTEGEDGRSEEGVRAEVQGCVAEDGSHSDGRAEEGPRRGVQVGPFRRQDGQGILGGGRVGDEAHG